MPAPRRHNPPDALEQSNQAHPGKTGAPGAHPRRLRPARARPPKGTRISRASLTGPGGRRQAWREPRAGRMTCPGGAMSAPFMFATGIENSYPTIRGGQERVDEMEKCRHYDEWRRDFDCVEQLGIRFLRY